MNPLLNVSRHAFTLILGLTAALLVGCSGSSGDNATLSDSVLVNGDFPIAYVKRSTSIRINPTDGTPFAPGGDLLLREAASPSAKEHNLTAHITQGVGDVSDPEASYDGKRIVFALRCPITGTATVDLGAGPVPACTGRWNLWEYDSSTAAIGQGTLRRLTHSTADDDVDPAYLPEDRGLVFSSNRQSTSRFGQALGQNYKALDEYEREEVLNLHTMALNGTRLQQITFNLSHDRNPVVRANGEILFSRWEHVADRNRFAVFRVKPDGTDLFVVYGAHSPGNSFLHPRETEPSGRFGGFLTSSLVPLSRSQEGGALQFINAAQYSEDTFPATRGLPASGGQYQPTPRALNADMGFSEWGRITTPFPLWDGTDRILLAWRPCEVTRNGVLEPCAGLSAAEKAQLANRNRTLAAAQADTLRDDAPAAYAIFMFNPADGTWLSVATPPPGHMLTDPVPMQARREPALVADTPVADFQMLLSRQAMVEVRSVYDTDGLQRMGEVMLTAADLAPGCAQGIATRAPADSSDPRPLVADVARLRDPADPAYHCAPARFVRVLRAVPPPTAGVGMRDAIGETEFEMQQIVGYAPVEPDGSVRLRLPANAGIALQVLDAEGRAFQTHANWMQFRPAERRTCNGCHSPRRGGSLNSGTVTQGPVASWLAPWSAAHLNGETMAALRTRLDGARANLAADPRFVDDWADTTRPGVRARASVSLLYSGNADAADDLATPVPSNGVIHYPEHIQPLWTRPRGPGGAHTCTACHNNPARLDLRATAGGSGRLQSYDELLLGDPLRDAAGQVLTQVVNGVALTRRGPALVQTSSAEANTAGQARKSRLSEILWGQALLASAAARTTFPAPPAGAPNHAQLLNKGEKRLLAEWLDLGGQYFNSPFQANGAPRVVSSLSPSDFATQVMPILQTRCASCHTPGVPGGPRYVLTGNTAGDYNATLAVINDTCNPQDNPLLVRPATAPHPIAAAAGSTPLPAGSADHTTVAAWVARGCTSR